MGVSSIDCKRRFYLFIALCCVTLAPLQAASGNRYEFTNDDLLGPAQLLSPWWLTLQRNALQAVQFERCVAEEAVCQPRERVLRRLLLRAADMDPVAKLELVNRYVNRTDYEDDRRAADPNRELTPERRRSLPSHWATLYEFLRSGGDCEDYASAKYFLLRRLGLAAEDMRVVVTYERRLRGFHAVLAFRWPSGDVWLLESDNHIKKRSHAGYRYVYALNEKSVWDYRPEP